MNKQELKHSAKQYLARLQNSIFRTIAQFPEDWRERHFKLAIKYLVENPELTNEEVIDKIKDSWVEPVGKWQVNKK